MKKRILQLISGLLCLILLASGTGCSYAILGCSAASCVPQEIKEQIGDTFQELSEMAAQNSTEKQAAATYPKEPGSEAANAAFLSLDRELFTWYITTDILTFDQYCYDPRNFGIDETSVPVTLGELTEDAKKEWVITCETWLNRLKTLDADHLGEQYRLAYDNYIRFFETEIAYGDLYYYYEPLEQYVGVHLVLPLTFGLYTFQDTRDVENYLTLLSDMPRYFQQILDFETGKAQSGIFMTQSMLDAVLSDLDSVANSGENCFLRSTFRKALKDVNWLDQNQKQTFYAENDARISDSYLEAYRLLREGLEKLRPYCRTNSGARNLDEKALRYFELRFQTESAFKVTVSEGLDLLSDLSESLYEQLKKAYQESSGKENPITTGTVQGDERYLRTLITDFLPSIPSVTVQYEDIPAELRSSFGPAAFLIPASDHFTENTILVNPAENTDLMTLAHEGFPGHLYQYAYQYSLGTIPLFQMTIEPNGYAEGWAKYGEYSIAKRADMFGTADCIANVLNQNLTNLIVARCSLLVNGNGSSLLEITEYLKTWGLEEHAEEIYTIAVNMPFYYFKYVMGFCQQYRIWETCKNICAFREKDFYIEFLSWGPSWYDLLESKMTVWATWNSSQK